MNKRTFIASGKFRAETTQDGTRHIKGYGAMYDAVSSYIRPGVRERLAKGAFNEADLTDVTANWNHNDEYILGRTTSGTLQVTPDELGLAFDVTLPDTSYARDLVALMERGDLGDQTSFAFTVSQDNIQLEDGENGDAIEVVTRINKVFDVSVVTRGAYQQPFAYLREDDNEESNNPKTGTSDGGKQADQTADKTGTRKNALAIALAVLELTNQLGVIDNE